MPWAGNRRTTCVEPLLCVLAVTRTQRLRNRANTPRSTMATVPPPDSDPRRHLVAAVLAAVIIAVLYHAWAFESWSGLRTGIDHNQEFFQDLTGPYLSQAAAFERGEGWQPGYLYPPTLALALQPLLGLSPLWISWVWVMVLALATIGLWRVGWGWLRPRSPGSAFAYTLLCGLSFPWLHDMHWGQVSTLVWAITLGSLLAWVQQRHALARVGLSLAIAIKIFPLWFLLALGLAGDRKGVLWVLGLSTLWLLGLPAIALGFESTLQFYAEWWQELGARGPKRYFSGEFWGPRMTQFLPAVLSRTWGGAQGAWLVFAWVVPLSLLAAVLLTAYRRLRTRQWARALILFASAMPLWVSPSWIHYFVWMPWALCVAWKAIPGLAPKVWIGLGMVGISTPLFHAVGGYPEYGVGGWPAWAALALPLAEWFSKDRPSRAQS